MEAISCVKAVVLAATQYKNNRNDDNLLHLHRQLDVLISITSKGSSLAFLHPKQLLSTECVACLVEIMNDCQIKASLAHKTMSLLNNLANASFLREFFRTTFDVTAVLISYMRNCLSQPLEENVILCVRLLQKLTYKAEISIQQNYVEELINFLIQQIVEVAENDLTQWCLGLLANLCRNNLFIRTYIKQKENCKAIFKKLMSYLSHRSQKVEIFAISIISSLCLEDEIGKRIFRDQNIHQVFQLLFNILHSGEPGMTQQYAVDLFVDIVQYEKIQLSLINYDHLVHCLQQILLLLRSSEANSSALLEFLFMTDYGFTRSDHRLICLLHYCNGAIEVLELLLGFSQVKELCSLICRLMLDTLSQDDATVDVLQTNQQKMAPVLAVIFWAAQPVECHENVHLLALDLLQVIHKAIFVEGLLLEKVALCWNPLLSVLQAILGSSVPPDSIFCKILLQRKLGAVKLLKILCENSVACSRILTCFNFQMLHMTVEQQLMNNMIGLKSTFASQQSTDDELVSVEVSLDLTLVILDLLLVLFAKDSQHSLQLNKVLKDPRLIPLLAYSLTSTSKERIQLALSLTLSAATVTEFSVTLLSENMSWINEMGRESGNMNRFVVSPSSSSSSCTSAVVDPKLSSSLGVNRSSSVDLDASVQNLIDKMQNGLKVKDIRSSELIAIYEHRLQSLQRKENSLQDLLEAKTTTLLQSDRLLSQFRLRIAQCEAEGHKLRSILQESERCKEDNVEKLEALAARCEELNTELELLGQENARLDEIAEKYCQLTQDYSEQSQRLDSCQRMLKTLKQEHESLVEMDEMLKRHYETLRQQQDRSSKLLVELEEEKNSLTIQLKDKEAKVFELSRCLQKTEENLKKRTMDCDELETAIDKLRAELARTEQTKKELQHQLSSLEVVCRQREASIKEKDILIGQQKAELEKHAQLAALIHSLSGGKNPAPPAF